MNNDSKRIAPGHLDGKRGDWFRRFPLKGCVWHQHMKYINDDKGNIIRSRVVGLELVATMEHWWMDKNINRPDLQPGDWDFRTPLDGKTGPFVPLDHKIKVQKDRQPHAWQLPWAWQYECLREWQPWSDFDRWWRDWRRAVKGMLDPNNDWICGKRTRQEAESAAAFSYGGRLPLWLLRDFRDYFPDTPWVKIPIEKRKILAHSPLPGSVPIPLDGSLLALKEPDPNGKGLPPIPKELQIQRDGVISLRQPDLNDAEEMAVYAEYRRQWSEAVQRQSEGSDTTTAGRYRREVVKEITPGQFVGTYIIHIPWYHTDGDLKAGFAAWLKKKESELGPTGCRKEFSQTGWDKPYAALKQLGALRLLRSGMTAEEARSHTEKTCGKALYERPSEWSEAKKKADDNLTAFHLGVA